MEVLLTIVGAAAVLALGVAWGRRMRRGDEREPSQQAPYDQPPGFEFIEPHRDAVAVADRTGRVIYRNAAARRLHGTHVGVLVEEAIDRHIAAAREHGRSNEVLEMYGPPKIVLVVEAVSLGERGVVVYVEDISEQRRIDQVRTDFVANISHELKTPVGALSVLAETLEDENDPETVRRVIGRMMSEAGRASRTIDDLIELSRIELGGERDIEPVRLAAVLDEAMGRVTELASRCEIGITSLASAGQLDGLVVHGDRRQLVSAVGNLVENAVKYSEPGGQVQVRARLVDGQVEIDVADQGVGIPQRDLDRIFERFYRVDRARSRETGGTGLGLSIVRHVAQNHGGTVDVMSVEGEGSTFTLRLPARLAHEARPEHDRTEPDASRPDAQTDRGIA